MNAKRFISYAALLAGVLILNGRLNAAVESDVVGYQEVTFKAGYNMSGIVFTGLDGKDIPFNKSFSGEFATGDMIMIPDPETKIYSIYMFRNGQWLDAANSYTPVSDDKTLVAGTTLWMVTPDRDVTVTFVGGVKPDDSNVTVSNGGVMVINPYPVAVALKDLAFANGPSRGDQIQVLNDKGEYDFYLYNGTWRDASAGYADASDVTIPAGKSFWLFSNQGDTVTFSSPLAK